MITNIIRGMDVNGSCLWMTEQLNETYNNVWFGTSLNTLMIIHQDAKAAVEFYLAQEPKTDHIQATVDNKYHYTMPWNAERKSILDSILKDLEL